MSRSLEQFFFVFFFSVSSKPLQGAVVTCQNSNINKNSNHFLYFANWQIVHNNSDSTVFPLHLVSKQQSRVFCFAFIDHGMTLGTPGTISDVETLSFAMLKIESMYLPSQGSSPLGTVWSQRMNKTHRYITQHTSLNLCSCGYCS